jgi:choice-of-anchor B domain-containing protein
MRTHPTRRSAPIAAAVLAATLATPAHAHDDDYRKLLDKQAMVPGPIVRLGEQITTGLFDSQGMTLLAQIPLNNFNGVNSSFGNDCWGYTSPSGREYVIMGLYGGYGFVEITNPTNPVIIDVVTGPGSDWHDVKVVGTYAYGVSEGGSGVQVMDLSDIDNGNVTLVRNWTSGGYSTTHNIVANEETGSLWIVGANIGNGGLIHLDISNPTLPQLDGGWTDMYVHDAQVVTWDSGPLAGRELAFCASGFSGGFSQTGLRIVDVTNPSNPVVLSTLYYPASGYAHQCWISEDQKYLYLNDELDEGSTVSVTTTRLINIEDPQNPFFVKTFTTGKAAIDHNLYVKDSVIYQSNYRSGLRVFDAINPADPIEIAYFDTYPGSDAASFNGAWSNYPYFESGTIAVSDIERGLFLLRLDAPLIPFALLESDLPATIAPDSSDTISVGLAKREGTTISTVNLMADTGSGFQPYAMSDNADGTWSVTAPTIDCDETFRYYFIATDTSSNVSTLPTNAPTNFYEAPVVSSIDLVYNDDFETNTGWSVSGSVADGAWERGIPAAGDRGDPPADFDGSGRCYLTDNQAGNSDVDGGTTILTSPALDATGTGTPVLSYALWYSNNIGIADDTMFVDISNNNGSTWQSLDTIGPGDPAAGGGWNVYEFDLTQVFTSPSSQVRVRFRAGDTGEGSVVEAAVDAVKITLTACEDPAPTCPADLNGDTSADFFDVSFLLQNEVDFNNDQGFDFFDISAFLQALSAGCP